MRWPAEASSTFHVAPRFALSFILPYTSELIDPVRADILAAQTRFSDDGQSRAHRRAPERSTVCRSRKRLRWYRNETPHPAR